MKDPLPGDTFRSGQLLNNTYEILGVLGRGGTGEVYKARNTINDRIVAIKVLNAVFAANEDYIELLKREEEIRAIVHDAVVRYSENSRTDEGHIYLVMDFVGGPSMNDHLHRGGMDARDLLIIAHRVGEGLVATHARGIVHRDLSPDNIILRDGDPARATIIDFGIAKDTSDGARTIVGNDFAGKYEYAAPEQIDGHAEARSDLYALGASLLATYRGEVPRVGTSPGQVVRIKQQPLDTNGVPEPLRKVVDWLCAPQISERPRDAAELVHYLDEIVMPKADKAEAAKKPHKRRRLWPWLFLLIGGAGAGGWVSGVLPPIVMPIWKEYFPDPIPVASPYRLIAQLDDHGDGSLAAHAPDEAQAQTIASAFATVTGISVPPEAVELAQGAPTESWASDISAFLNVASELEDWTLVVADRNLGLSGLATDTDEKAFIEARIVEVSGGLGYTAETDIDAGPRSLELAELTAAVAPLEDCGPFRIDPPEGEVFALGDTIRLEGDIAEKETALALQQRLERIIGDRDLALNLRPLNDEICTIGRILPRAGPDGQPIGPGQIAIELGYGDRDEINLTGIYKQNDNPTIDLVMPEASARGFLWVIVIDNTGNLYHLLPNINRRDNTVANIGKVENGLRRIPIAYPRQEAEGDNSKLYFTVDENFGKSQIVVVRSNEPLVQQLRPGTESVDAFAEALEQRLASSDTLKIDSIATRIIDARDSDGDSQ